jgi:hypothetical protein
VVARDATVGVLRLDCCRVERPIAAARLVASVLALRGTSVIGHDSCGAVDLRGARLGRLDCDGATLTNGTGPALNGDSLRVELDVSLRGGFRATGAGIDGAVCLLGARAARVECDGATLRNDTGPAFRADSLNVEQRAFLRRGFTADGSGPIGVVRLNGARLGLFSCDGATMRNDSGPAIIAESVQAERGAFFGPDLSADGHGEQGVLRLAGTRVAGRLHLDAGGLRNTLDGGAPSPLTVSRTPGCPRVHRCRNGWLCWAARSPTRHSRTSSWPRDAGPRARTREARTVLIAQRRDELRRGHLTPAVRTWTRITSLTLGYGYRPWLALVWLTAVAVAAVALAVALGATGGLARPGPAAAPCSVVQRVGVGVGLDLSIPLVKTGARQQRDVTDTAAGQWLTVAGWALQLLGWAFATLFVAGFTGAVRRPGQRSRSNPRPRATGCPSLG